MFNDLFVILAPLKAAVRIALQSKEKHIKMGLTLKEKIQNNLLEFFHYSGCFFTQSYSFEREHHELLQIFLFQSFSSSCVTREYKDCETLSAKLGDSLCPEGVDRAAPFVPYGWLLTV